MGNGMLLRPYGAAMPENLALARLGTGKHDLHRHARREYALLQRTFAYTVSCTFQY
jgi:hypothetical protein